jgi:hypothetical protein
LRQLAVIPISKRYANITKSSAPSANQTHASEIAKKRLSRFILAAAYSSSVRSAREHGLMQINGFEA